VKLFHYTSAMHLPHILEDGFLEVTESNIDIKQPHAGPDVVWLTVDPLLFRKDAEWAHGTAVDKLAVRFAVNVSDAVHWPKFAARHKMKRQWYVQLARAGGDPSTWYVVPRRIMRSEWREILVVRGVPQPLTIDPQIWVPA
jgi:hypothetical protein